MHASRQRNSTDSNDTWVDGAESRRAKMLAHCVCLEGLVEPWGDLGMRQNIAKPGWAGRADNKVAAQGPASGRRVKRRSAALANAKAVPARRPARLPGLGIDGVQAWATLAHAVHVNRLAADRQRKGRAAGGVGRVSDCSVAAAPVGSNGMAFPAQFCRLRCVRWRSNCRAQPRVAKRRLEEDVATPVVAKARLQGMRQRGHNALQRVSRETFGQWLRLQVKGLVFQRIRVKRGKAVRECIRACRCASPAGAAAAAAALSLNALVRLRACNMRPWRS